MKKGFSIFLILLAFLSTNAQKKNAEKTKDTVRTEVINVVTKYNPKIADAKKIKKNPSLAILQKSKKQKLKYNIFSAPVASTFTPKSGIIKGIDVGVKELIYNNYLAVGFGNYSTPIFETYLQHNTRFENAFGFSAKYLASLENTTGAILNNNYSTFSASLFYQQEEPYFTWRVSLDSEQNKYNWYGLPSKNFTKSTISDINEEQNYNYFKLNDDFNFNDSSIDYGKLTFSYFTDDYKSTEILAKISGKLDFPLYFINPDLNDITLNTSVEFLTGKFKNNYKTENPLKYSFTTAKLNPAYKLTYNNFIFKIGTKLFVSLDSEKNATNFYVFPDVSAQTTIIKKYLSIYGGISGDLHTNTYKEFTESNPYVSPTLLIKQTAEKTNLFIGLNGKINNDISFNIKASAKNENDKPLFLRNNSKSDGTTSIINGIPLKGYEFGNSFSIIYDDVKTNTISAEIEYDFTKRTTFGSKIKYNNYKITNALEKWNLPTLEASFLGKYKTEKWYATTNIFYASERKDALYMAEFPSDIIGTTNISSFIDVNLNGGYHFNNKFSAFLKLNNVLNNNYQRFANFSVQGFQVLGGITCKFDF